MVAGAGLAVDNPAEFATAIREMLGWPERERRERARARAEEFSWNRAVNGFLSAHGA